MPIQVAGKLIPRNDNTWPVVDDAHIEGGYRVVADLLARNAIDVTTLTSASGRTQANSGDPDNGGAGLGAAAGNTGESSTSPYLGYKGSNGKIIVSY